MVIIILLNWLIIDFKFIHLEKLTEIEEKLDLIRTHVAEQKSASAETENGKTTTEPGEHIENDNVAQKSTKDKSPTELQQFGR